MFSQYFGHYLLNNGLLTSEQLHTALQLQQTTHVKFGVIAVDEGLLTSAQVEEIHEKQKQQDKRFGEIAVDLGYLSNEQVEEMLTAQKKNHLLLAQAIVDQNYMTIDAFSNALTDYKNLHSLSDEKFAAIKDGNIEAMIESLLQLNEEEKQCYSDYLSLFVKNIIRFIDGQVFVEISSEQDELRAEWLVSQEIKGKVPLYTAFALEESVFLQIASIYAEEELTEANELAQASVSEFLNLHNGIYLVNMSNKGIELDMDPQKIEKNAVISTPPAAGLTVDVHTSKGKFHLVISKLPKLVNIIRSVATNEAI